MNLRSLNVAALAVLVCAGLNLRAEDMATGGDAFEADGLSFTVSGTNEVSVSGFAADANLPESLRVPDSVRFSGKVYAVRRIGSRAFAGSALKNIELGQVRRIEEGAFSGSQELLHLHLPASLLVLGKEAFADCGKLRTVNNGESLAVVPEGAFRDCGALYSVSLGAGVSAIENGAFKGCVSLKSMVVPDGVSVLTDSVFARCTSLSRVSCGSGMSSIAASAFSATPLEELLVRNQAELVEGGGNVPSGATVYVPEEMVELYEADPDWSGNHQIKPLSPLRLTLQCGGREVDGDTIGLACAAHLRLVAAMTGEEYTGKAGERQPLMSWKTDSACAAVDETGDVTGVSPGLARIAVRTRRGATTYSAGVYVKVEYAVPTSVTVRSQNDLMALGTTMRFEARVNPIGSRQAVGWSVTDTSLAKIDSLGVIHPKRAGRVTVTAAAVDVPRVSGSKVIEICHAKPQKVTVSVDKEELFAGDTAMMSAAVDHLELASQDVRWFTGDDSIATVDGDGMLECHRKGKVVITAMTTNDVHYIGALELEIGYARPTGIAVEEDSVCMKVGDVMALRFEVFPANAEQSAIWTVEHDSIACVDGLGEITALAPGETCVHAQSGSHQAVVRLRVDYADPRRVYINYTGVTMHSGDSTMLTARVFPSGAMQRVVWHSMDTTVALVDSCGIVTAVREGNTAVIAQAPSDSTVFGGCNVIVIPNPTSIDGLAEPEGGLRVRVEGGVIRVGGGDAGSAVEVYDLDGRRVATVRADGAGEASVAPGRGVFIVRAGRKSCKVIVTDRQ